MKGVALQLPTLAFVVSTRAALAGGIGLLLSERIPADRRRKLGTFLVAVGAVTTIPAVWSIARHLTRRERTADSWGESSSDRGSLEADDNSAMTD